MVRGNVFRNCITSYGSHGFSFGIISVCPTVHNIDAQIRRYHGNVSIEDNVFETFNVPLLYAFSTDGLIWRRNRIARNNGYEGVEKPPFIVKKCENLEIE